jgi:hypothetical protein
LIVDLEKALEQFDTVEANVRRLQTVWDELSQLIPDGLMFTDDSGPEDQRYRELRRAYRAIVRGLPPIGDVTIVTVPWELNEIGQARFDAVEIGEFDAKLSVETDITLPGREIDEYRAALIQARRELVRDHLVRLMSEIEPQIQELAAVVPHENKPIDDARWDKLADDLRQVVRLTGSMVPGKARWRDLRRHLSFGQCTDLHDIAGLDWPSVRKEIEANLYSELEPLPVSGTNLADLVRAKPGGPVTTKLNWDAINAEEFERLLFNIVADAPGYTNPQWLMHTNAPDRGRDISVERVSTDSLSGTRNQRVIIQAKHWLTRSVRPADVTEALTQMTLWKPPRVHTLVIATSGRFTVDAVTLIEIHNDAGKQPAVEMWPESHLEFLLAQRPHLVAEFKLRSSQ